MTFSLTNLLKVNTMYRNTTLVLLLCFLIAPSRAQGYDNNYSQSVPRAILSFKTMYGVEGLFIGDANPVRGVIGDELPWRIAKSTNGKLLSNGRLVIHVRGLVFPDDPRVPVDLRGKNDETEFRGLVSCLTEEGGAVVERNVITEGFPATEKGNSNIKADLTLPIPCVAPIIMVLAGSEDKWFSITGF